MSFLVLLKNGILQSEDAGYSRKLWFLRIHLNTCVEAHVFGTERQGSIATRSGVDLQPFVRRLYR
jgi:hypothetical protein